MEAPRKATLTTGCKPSAGRGRSSSASGGPRAGPAQHEKANTTEDLISNRPGSGVLSTRPVQPEKANAAQSPISSRPGSGNSLRSAGQMIVRSVNSTTAMPEIDLLQLLPAGLRENLMQLPADMRDQLLTAAKAALSTRGTGEAIATFTAALRQMDRQSQPGYNSDQVQWHGLLGNSRSWSPPKVAARSEKEARPGYNAYSSTEYLDCPDVLKAKAKLLAQMWRRSARSTVVYTGAGLSTASGIGDYASKASNSVAPHRKQSSTGSRLELQPTLAHHALSAMEDKGFIGNWVQQNHDRLAQKAGFPQSKLNEIHGAWGDMKNTVKMMDDSLRSDLLDWLVAWADHASMCVTLGTSLCGMNADQVPRAVAERYAQSSGEGLVIIGLQQTAYDNMASLRMWGLCDEVMKLVAKELGCKIPDPKVVKRGQVWDQSHPRLTYNTPTRTSRDPM